MIGKELYDALFVRSNRVAILLEPDGRVVDVTDREQRVAALERQNARLEEFVRVVSHDLVGRRDAAHTGVREPVCECPGTRFREPRSSGNVIRPASLVGSRLRPRASRSV
ncbi:hypothetical protein BRC61_00295 [Halobacteriales archaeon QH_10_65_19]|nr:MAG: hypothetical protein BRC61_00295 [Halobacteriales archaeon QH_10_65_19]